MFSHFQLSRVKELLVLLLISAAALGQEKEKPVLKLGGALRFNYVYSSWKEEQKTKGGEFGYDMFRINAKASYKNVFLNAEYRLYSEAFGGGFLKQGWIGYKFNEKDELHVGLVYVPFGIKQYNSHNWFFNITYYVGLEDDHDMGLKYVHTGDKWDYALAFLKNAEELNFGGGVENSSNRYSYDIVGRNKETNQFNGKVVRKWGEDLKHRIGFSWQFGSLYNIDTNKNGSHYALTLHYEMNWKSWNLKTEAITVSHAPENAPGESNEIIKMGAYGTPYEVAARFDMYTAAVSKKISVNWGPISQIEVYNDFGYMQKKEKEFTDSFQNVTGLLVTAGQVYTYIDYAAGYNHSWLGGNFVDDFSTGNPDAKWEARFNINIGYYF
ncbi:hypothetical protein DSM03_104100 [Leeuwenhoekiella aestuarii]|uniref:Phosphate-selective porin O/P n=1 Tax=Leeuwenhoekiella aestuarii TaxID=2249426 RepID=A0A4Q0NRQ9_9FLAO|nr:hypothetical protein [Leeuwenhoekiella aestuarii]RXG13326.1 hypothetical protein DSM04_105305 [Leeuwenhoekiella aestuarii]RXG14943.1 hypothetical protein DSM03_104100 [Leeuwenhoekiella aestuarii]